MTDLNVVQFIDLHTIFSSITQRDETVTMPLKGYSCAVGTANDYVVYTYNGDYYLEVEKPVLFI